MPTIAPPPPSDVLSRIAAPPQRMPAAAPGRTLADYVQFFALDLAALRGRDVLDVGAGAASFVAEACARRIAAVAVDPMYGDSPGAVAERVLMPPPRPATFPRSDPASGAEAQGAPQRFLADYETHFMHGRYVTGTLPRLPFFDGTFDLVLCAHVLFVSAARHDFEWHLAAARELMRVSAGEVRIYPLCGADRRPYSKLAALRRELKAGGIASETRTLGGDLPPRARSLLTLRKAAS